MAQAHHNLFLFRFCIGSMCIKLCSMPDKRCATKQFVFNGYWKSTTRRHFSFWRETDVKFVYYYFLLLLLVIIITIKLLLLLVLYWGGINVCVVWCIQIIDDFLSPSTPLDQVVFTTDLRLCFDHESNVFDMANGFLLANMLSCVHTGEDLKRSDGDWIADLPKGGCPRNVSHACLAERILPRGLILNGYAVLYVDMEYLSVVRVSDLRRVGRICVHAQISTVQVCLFHRFRSTVTISIIFFLVFTSNFQSHTHPFNKLKLPFLN